MNILINNLPIEYFDLEESSEESDSNLDLILQLKTKELYSSINTKFRKKFRNANKQNKSDYKVIKKLLVNIFSLLHLYSSRINYHKTFFHNIKNGFEQLIDNNYDLTNSQDVRLLKKSLNKIIKNILQTFVEERIKDNKCIVPECCNEAISSHTISKANNFKGNYVSFKENLVLGVSMYKAQLISKKKASTLPLFCSTHDRDLFLPIENGNNIDMLNADHLFLQSWRTFTAYHMQAKKYKYRFMDELYNHPDKVNKISSINIPDYMNSLDGQVFRGIKENPELLLLSLELDKSPLIISSVIVDTRYVSKEFNKEREPWVNYTNNYFYIHILPNGENPMLNISAFKSEDNEKVFNYLKNLYLENKVYFWNKILHFISSSSNVFLEKEFFENNPNAQLFFDSYKEMHQEHNNPYKKPNYNKKAKQILNSKDIEEIFGKSKLVSNF